MQGCSNRVSVLQRSSWVLGRYWKLWHMDLRLSFGTVSSRFLQRQAGGILPAPYAPLALAWSPGPSHEDSADSPAVSLGELAKLCSGFLAGIRVFFGPVKLSLHLKWRTVRQTCFCCQRHSILITSKQTDHFLREYAAPLNPSEPICVTGFVQPRQKWNTPPARQPLPHVGCHLKAPTPGLCWMMCSKNVPVWSSHGGVEHPVRGHQVCVVWSVGLWDQLALRSSLPELCWPAQALTSVSDSKKMLLLQ